MNHVEDYKFAKLRLKPDEKLIVFVHEVLSSESRARIESRLAEYLPELSRSRIVLIDGGLTLGALAITKEESV